MSFVLLPIHFLMFYNKIASMFIICVVNTFSKSVLKVKIINCQVEWIFILKMKVLKPRCLRHFSGRKKKNRKSFCVEKKKEKMQFMEIAIFNITSYLHSVLTIFKPRESAAGMAQIHLQRISAFQRAEPLIVLQLRTSFVSLLPLPWMDRKVLVW